MEDDRNVCLPVQLEAFILNEPVADGGSTLIAPITQPNYVSLRLSNSVIQHDLLPHVDLSNAKPAKGNPRVSQIYSTPFSFLNASDPAPGPTAVSLNQARFGVYLHWSIPRGYRSGKAASKTPADPNNPQNRQAAQQAAQPTFQQVPDRWLVVRILRDHEPKTANVDTVTAWVVESNRLRNLSELDPNIDLQTEVTPFVAYQDQDATTNLSLLDNQAEKYIGYKTSLHGWSEDASASRVPLTTMNSTNPLFADYAIHNPNVFSTHDNFSYGDGSQFLQTATCDYIVVGWHSSVANPTAPSPAVTDPLREIAASSPLDPTLKGRLGAIFCQLPSGSNPDNKDGTRLICHSAIYGIKYEAGARPETPADTFADRLTGNGDINMEPVSVGTTPLDAILSFLEAHKDPADNAFEEALLDDKGSVTASRLRSMTELLYATQDTYDERTKAADLIYHHNFSQSGGGFVWRYDKKKKTGNDETGAEAPSTSPPAAPSATDASIIAQLNTTQRLLDVVQSKLQLIQWSLFSEFFKYCSDPYNEKRIPIYSSRAPPLSAEGHALQGQVQTLTEGITTLSQTVQVKKFAAEPFFSRNDPTLCIAGLDSGWPDEYLGSTPTRTGSQVLGPHDPKLAPLAKPALDLVSVMPIAPDLRNTIGRLVSEASGGFPAGKSLLGHTAWSGKQPFSPQFVEWEGIYYHVGPFEDQWDLGVDPTGTSESNQEQLRYVNPKTLADSSQKWFQDSRHLSGRILVLPQPGFALTAVVKQVLASTPDKDLPPCLDLRGPNPDAEKAKKDAFVAAAGKLKFISGDLTGLKDGLLTLATGSHVKPNLRQAGQLTVPMKAAVCVGDAIGLKLRDFELMDAETAKTPFGTLTDFTGAPSPFKGVQHGQLAITKLTIVDKFGQAVCCPPTQRTPYTPSKTPQFVNPCLADQLLPTIDDHKLNIVYNPDKPDAPSHSGYPMSPFIQLTPTINQDARINACFVQKDNDAKGNFTQWRPSTAWENPIIGWIVVNYADSGLQFFTTEGVFYTSVRFGGPTGVIKPRHDWLPFSQPPRLSSTVPVSDQLVALVNVLSDTSKQSTAAQYLLSLWKTIETAIQTMPFAPSAYSGTANAIVGKPLALVNVGWSLELAQPPLWPQHTLPAPDVVIEGHEDPLRAEAKREMSNYKFKIKLGDVSYSIGKTWLRMKRSHILIRKAERPLL